MVEQPQAHDRGDDQGKRQGQPAHGALLELLLVAERSLVLPSVCPDRYSWRCDNSTILLLRPPKDRSLDAAAGGLLGQRQRRATKFVTRGRVSASFYLRAIMLS